MRQVPKPYEHQKDAFCFIQYKDQFALFMEMGCGKSKVTIDKATWIYKQGLIDCIIIISPNAVKEQWITEQFPIHYPYEDWYGYLWDGAKTKKSKYDFHKGLEDKDKLFVFSCNVDAFQSDSIDIYIKAILNKRIPFVVIDESTRIKNGRRKTKRGKRAGAKRTNKILDFFEFTKYKAILTGTPTPNSPFDLWAQYEFLQKDFFKKDYFIFQHYYGIMINKQFQGRKYNTTLSEVDFKIAKSKLKNLPKKDAYNMNMLAQSLNIKTPDLYKIDEMSEFSSYKHLDKLKEEISKITFFVRKQDCLDLPDKVYETLYCEMGKEQKKLYETLKKDMYAEYQSKQLTVTTKMVMACRLQMIAGGLFPYIAEDIIPQEDGEIHLGNKFKYSIMDDNIKIKVLLEDLEDIPEDVYPIIWASFRGEIDLICNALYEKGYTYSRYYGGDSIESVNLFKTKKVRFLVANPGKGGEGLNLQMSTLHYFYSNSFKADARLQAEDRSHRIGQTNKVTYKDLICKNTVDERIHQVLRRKENLIEFFRQKPIEGIIF